MEKYVKEMNIYRRPRGNDASSYEDFESFTLQLLATTPVMVTVECLPGFLSFDGQVSPVYIFFFFFFCLIYYLLLLILSMKTFNFVGNFQSIRHGLSYENL